MDFETARQELFSLREDGTRDSERVIELWVICLSQLAYKLGDDAWTVYEQVFIAAIDLGNDEIAQDCISALIEKFPNSTRVKRLRGMYYEYSEKFEEARNLYNQIIEEDPTNMIIRKRLIAILKAEGKHSEAIKELREYLEKFQSDTEAWGELCDYYLNDCDYKKAAFCMEELILSNPHNHLYYQKYAEIKYSEGGIENCEIAKTYFSQALTLHPDNVRALYGLLLTSTHLSQNAKSKAKEAYINSAEWAAKELTRLYENAESLEHYDMMSDKFDRLTLGNVHDEVNDLSQLNNDDENNYRNENLIKSKFVGKFSREE
jgi:tetratricopeptide (TPR) repeat protein